MLLLLDNYDSFTYILLDYFKQLGISCRVVRNDQYSVQSLLDMHPDYLVLSPGPETPDKAGIMMELLEKCRGRIPILGVCLGHQAIGTLFGANLVKARRPMHGKCSTIQLAEHPVFEGLPEKVEVMRYHSLILEDLRGTGLRGIAYTEDGELMALANDEERLLGLQFHPESVMTKHGLRMLENWLTMHDFSESAAKSSRLESEGKV